MVLSPDARVLSGQDFRWNPDPEEVAWVLVTATNTVDVGPTELEFPQMGVTFVTPRFGTISYNFRGMGGQGWTQPRDVVLSSQRIRVPRNLGNLRRIALVPASGCSMDVVLTITQRT